MSDEKKERYNLQEAAEIMAQGEITGTSELLLRNLKQSVRDGDLKVFPSDSNIRYEPDMDDESRATRESGLLCHETDVLPGGFTWLDKMYDKKLYEALHPVLNNLEAYWNDLNTWIEQNEPRIGPIFQNPGIPVPEKESVPVPKPPLTRVHKLRRNILDPAIDKAVKKAESNNLAEVYLALKELALAEEPPFTGEINGNSLLYTNSNNELKSFNREALRQRLKRR